LGRSFTAKNGVVGAFDFTEIAQPFRCFRELGEERYPLIVQEADEPRDYGEAAELEQIRSAGPALPVTNTGFARGYTLDVAGMGFVENGRAGGRHIRDCIHGSSPNPRSGAGEPWRRQTAWASAPASIAGFVL
jgi:hypothetical protein